MARLQAYHVLTRDPEQVVAHELLGHKETSRGWQWKLDGKKVSRAAFAESRWYRRSSSQNDQLRHAAVAATASRRGPVRRGPSSGPKSRAISSRS